MATFKSKYILPLAALWLCAAGCDDIAADDRYIEVDAVKVERTVLLEDFTGQNCINCPAAHRTIEALEQQYGDNFIAVSIHAGPFAVSADHKRYTGLMQPEGQTYNDRYGIEDYPKGVLDGHLPALNPDQWAAAVYSEIAEKTPVSITLRATHDADGNSIAIDCDVKSTEAVKGDFVVWIVESGIVARQEDIENGRIPDYVHNHVFRACVNGIDGVAMEAAPAADFSAKYSIPVKDTATEKWNVGNLAVVAFVKTASGIVQAATTQIED